MNGSLNTPLQEGQTVLVDDPTHEDAWNHGFVGQVYGFRNDWVQIVDGEGDVWEMEPYKCTVQDED